jgi:hypothetical protein
LNEYEDEVFIGGLRPNTIILGFYDNATPEDKLRSHHFYKRRWLKSSLPINTQHITRSDASTVTLNSSNDNDTYSIFHFRGINILLFIFLVILNI